MRRQEGIEGVINEFTQGLGVPDLLQLFHALLVGNSGGLHLLDFLPLELVRLTAENGVWILDNGFAEGEHVEGIVGAGAVEQGKGVDEIE